MTSPFELCVSSLCSPLPLAVAVAVVVVFVVVLLLLLLLLLRRRRRHIHVYLRGTRSGVRMRFCNFKTSASASAGTRSNNFHIEK